MALKLKQLISSKSLRLQKQLCILPKRHSLCAEPVTTIPANPLPEVTHPQPLGVAELLKDASMSSTYAKYLSRSTYEQTLQPIETAWGLFPEIYTDDAWNRLEKEKVFKRAWVAIDMKAGRVTEHGDILSTQIAGIPILITNDKGELKAFYNICRHRASVLMKEGIYKNCNVIRCPYHSWTFSCGGDLVRAPFFNDDKMPSNSTQKADSTKKSETIKFTKIVFDKKDYGLYEIGVKDFMGTIYVNLDPDKERREKLFAFQFGDLAQHYGHYPYDDMRIVIQRDFEINANWKLIMENTNDYYHSFTIHPELLEYSSTSNHIRRQGMGQYNGIATYPVTSGGTASDPDRFPHFKGMTEADRVAAWFIHVFPNVDYFLMPHHVLTLITQPHPTKAGVCTEKLTIMFDKDIQAKYFEGDQKTVQKIEDLKVFWGRVNDQDIEAVERAQHGMNASKHVYRGGRISAKFEETFYRFQHILIDYMTDEYMKDYPGDDDFGPSDELPQYDMYGNLTSSE